MKVLQTMFCLVLVMLALAGCNRRDDNEAQPTPQAQPGLITMRVDNQVWSAYGSVSGSSGMIIAQRGNDRLELQLPSFSPGTYNFTTSTTPGLYLVQYGSPARDYASNVCSPVYGRLIITNYDGNRITGTFDVAVCTSDGARLSLTQGVFTQLTIQ